MARWRRMRRSSKPWYVWDNYLTTDNTWIVFFEGNQVKSIELFDLKIERHYLARPHWAKLIDGQDEMEVFKKLKQEEGSWFDNA